MWKIGRNVLPNSGKEIASHRIEAFVIGLIGGGAVVLTIVAFYMAILIQKQPFLFGNTGGQALAAAGMSAVVIPLAVCYELYQQGQLRSRK